MSTKIYNGFRIDTTTFENPFLAIAQLVEGFKPEAYAWSVEACAQLIKKVGHNAVMAAQDEIKNTQRRMPGFDFSCFLSFVPFRDYVLGIIFTERPELRKMWMDQACVEKFPYWNNTDPPDGISDEDWCRRGELWDLAVGGDPVNQRAFSITLVEEQLYYDVRVVERVRELGGFEL